MELGHHVLAAKRAAVGDGRLNAHDLKQLRRGRGLAGLWKTPLLRPSGLAGAWLASPGAGDGSEGKSAELAVILGRLARQGFAAYAVDLSRGYLGLPAVKVLVPGLQPNPSVSVSPRLKAAVERTGGGDRYTKGVALL